ncbi:MAG TPA: hypothetical protein VN380_11175 [Thermoanaerobaculia bacterium]|jgi:hypothetical protein|nr:hypothetical protein [Thermoanaerobaculia bacterium]
MPPLRNPSAWPLVTIQTGAALFIAALAASVYFEPAVWLLHTLQALIYVGVIVLVRQDSDWGFGAGFAIALLWNSANLFATGFIRGGIDVLLQLPRTEHFAKPGLLLVLVGAAGHFLMIAGCLVCFLRRGPKLRQWGKFLGGGVLGVCALVMISPLRTHALPLPLDIRSRLDSREAAYAEK